MSSKKIIFLNRFYWPDHSATSQLLSEIAPALTKIYKDSDVHIITSRLLYDEPAIELTPEQLHEGINIHRVFSSRFGRSNLLGRAIDYLSFYIFSCIKLFSLANSKSVVIVKTDPPMLSVPCGWITKLRGAKQINWLQDIYPEIVEALYPGTLPKLILRFLIWIRNSSLANADMNVAISEDMAKFLVAQGIPQKKVTVIENWTDTTLIAPVSHDNNKLRQTWKLVDKTVIMYSGNMGRSHYIDTIIYAADKLKYDKSIVFLFVGGGAQKIKIQQLTQKLGLTNVIFKNYQPRDVLSQSLSVGDVHIVSLKVELASYIYPSKIYGVLAAGRPLIFIGNKESLLAKYIFENKLGYTVGSDVDEILKAVKTLHSEVEDNENEINKRIRCLAVKKHCLAVAVERWCLIILNNRSNNP